MSSQTAVIDCYDLYALIKRGWKDVPDMQMRNFINAALQWCIGNSERYETERILNTPSIATPPPSVLLQDSILTETRAWLLEALNLAHKKNSSIVNAVLVGENWTIELSYRTINSITPQQELFDLISSEIADGHHYPARIRTIIEKNQRVYGHVQDG